MHRWAVGPQKTQPPLRPSYGRERRSRISGGCSGCWERTKEPRVCSCVLSFLLGSVVMRSKSLFYYRNLSHVAFCHVWKYPERPSQIIGGSSGVLCSSERTSHSRQDRPAFRIACPRCVSLNFLSHFVYGYSIASRNSGFGQKLADFRQFFECFVRHFFGPSGLWILHSKGLIGFSPVFGGFQPVFTLLSGR